MRREIPVYLIVFASLATLAGCGKSIMNFAGERAPWRAQAEAECMGSGAVKESATVVRIAPIEGPGMCGAEMPLKVAALGDSAQAFGYAEELRPPGSIPGAAPRFPIAEPRYAPAPQMSAPAPRYIPNDPVDPGGPPVSLSPPAGAQYSAPRAYEPPRAYDPVQTRPAYDPREATVQPLRAPEQRSAPQYQPPRAPQYAPPVQDLEADDIPDDAVLPDPGRARPRSEEMQQYRPAPALGPQRFPMTTGSAKAAVSPAATLACPMVSALDQWVMQGVQPAALKWFKQPVVEIKQISAYSCRGMVGSGTHNISEHAFGNALDVAAFVLADGRRVTVKSGWWDATPEESGFLHDVQLAACERFSTVLAPGYNAAHADHLHLDLMRRSSGRRACKPFAMQGEVAAARQLERTKFASRRGDPMYTSSVAKPKGKPMIAGEDGDFDDADDVGPTGSITKAPPKAKPARKTPPKPLMAGEDGDFDDED